METVLVYSEDERFCRSCATQLKSEGYSSKVVASEKGIEDFFKEKKKADVIVLNAGSERGNYRHVLEMIHNLGAHPPVILTSEYFNYWNDFSTWLADDCLVCSGDLEELKEKIRNLISPVLPKSVAPHAKKSPVDEIKKAPN